MGDDEAAALSSTKSKEDLLGLNARLAIMEVPDEEEARCMKRWTHGARAVVEALKHQLQVGGNASVWVPLLLATLWLRLPWSYQRY